MELQKDAAGAPVHSIVHTPGPWTLQKPKNIHDVSVCEQEVIAKHQGRVIKICGIHNGINANAMLIAMAPQMLEDLRLVVEVFGDSKRREPKAEACLLMAVIDTIEKATGEKVV